MARDIQGLNDPPIAMSAGKLPAGPFEHGTSDPVARMAAAFNLAWCPASHSHASR
jgi:hypothetical protein